MANPTLTALTAIREQVTNWTQTDAEIRDALNTVTIPNPVAAPLIPKPMEASVLMGFASAETRAKLLSRPALVAFASDVRTGDREAVLNWIVLGRDAGDIPEDEFQLMLAELQATIPDPSYPPLLSWAELHLGRLVDLEDIAAARESYLAGETN